MIGILGLTGCSLFAISGVPTAVACIKIGNSLNIPKLTQWSVFLGAVLTLLYLILRNGFDWIITLDYSIMIISWLVVLKYEYFPR